MTTDANGRQARTGGEPEVKRDLDVALAEHLPRLLDEAIERIARLQEALVAARTGPSATTEQRRAAIFELYRDDLLGPGDVTRLSSMTRWDVEDFLADHPEYRPEEGQPSFLPQQGT
jgi:hypothetical protein